MVLEVLRAAHTHTEGIGMACECRFSKDVVDYPAFVQSVKHLLNADDGNVTTVLKALIQEKMMLDAKYLNNPTDDIETQVANLNVNKAEVYFPFLAEKTGATESAIEAIGRDFVRTPFPGTSLPPAETYAQRVTDAVDSAWESAQLSRSAGIPGAGGFF